MVCNIHVNYINKKYGVCAYNVTAFDRFLEKVEDAIQAFYDATINPLWYDRQEQKIDVKLDPWDTFSADKTLAHIIVPMLKQLRDTKHGSPVVDDDDVPEHLRCPKDFKPSDSGDVDDNFFKRWDWVLDEMIWAFEQYLPDESWDMKYVTFNYKTSEIVKIDKEGRKAHQERMDNGRRLFAKYYESLWD